MSKRRGDYSSSSNEKQKANKSHGNFDLDDSSHKEFDSLDAEIHVNLPDGQMMRGYLMTIHFDYNIAVIGLGPVHVFKEASLDQPGEVGYINTVTAICCNSTGKIMSLTGLVTKKSSELYGQKLIMSTCIIPEFGIGGPLVDSEGNFVGMNMSQVDNEGTLFLPKETILKSIVPYFLPSTFVVGQASCCRASIKQGSDNQIERSTSEICKSSTLVVLNSEEKGRGSDKSPETNQKSSVSSTSDSESESSQDTSELSNSPLPDNEFMKAFTNDLLSRGYPLPKMLEGGMELRKNFEEEFAGDIWNRLTKKVALDTSLSVVSLASFRGETRFFACTGVLIGRHKSITRILTSASLVRLANKNEIDGSLKIRVLLPNKKHATGKLQHHNLHYNIAVVSIRNFHCRRIAKLHIEKPVYPLNDNQVVAIGSTFDTGKLMATSGVLTDNSSNLVSEEHGICTCKITKAGIGGPLIDFCGNFIGMNFYDAKRTPYLPRHIILEQLKDFDRKGSAAAKINEDGDPNRFSVPGPYWWYPSLAPRFIYERRRKH
ncbi:hypothetical protein SETIT_9G357800v2 [Setaria italica]|uniref:Uncharacterized protein n=1 Tax=Setaria italica TaxID=4555 RepID=A0A368SP83_SETIT|nr:uncharacterized protein LOC101767318 isoform X2 [Setaria italica]RCV44242.1 hypothetical protein SETIT_9G357800v2 [Setaria italica]